MNEPVIRFSPGGMLPFSGAGAQQDGSPAALHWAIASNGLIQRTERFQWRRWQRGPGGPPTTSCALCGMRVSTEHAHRVDGRTFHPDCAPLPRGG